MLSKLCQRIKTPNISNIRIIRYLSTSQSKDNYERLLLEKYEDPLKKRHDERMHKHYGSDDAIKLSKSDINILMPNDNITAVLNKILTINIFELEKPSIIEPWEILLEIINVGVCGSDLEYYKHGKIAHYILNQPMIMGHETGAKILALGSQAKKESKLKIGDIVALEPGLVCGECTACKSKMYNLCPEVAFFATPPVHGTMRRYMKHHFKYCYKVGNSEDEDEERRFGEIAALCEPLSVGIHSGSKNIAGIKDGDKVGIFGAGPIGIINMLTSIYYGATDIFITDVLNNKLEIVNNYIKNNPNLKCNIRTINTKEEPFTNEFISNYNNLCDHTFECVGNKYVLKDALNITKSGGMITIIGMAANSNMEIDISNLNIQEKTINGVFRYRYTYNEAIKMLLSGKVGDVRQLITSRPYAWDQKQLENGFETIDKNMKIMFQL